MPPRAGEPKTISLEDLIPVPGELGSLDPSTRHAFWRIIGDKALAVKRREILDGIGADGEDLQPVRRTEGGPPLIPHDARSRTYRLLSLSARANGATLFWRAGGGRTSWPTILGYHAYMHGPRSLPVRNTIGISPEGRRAIAVESEAWRAGYKAGREAALKDAILGKGPRVKVSPGRQRPRVVEVKETKVERQARERAEAEARRRVAARGAQAPAPVSDAARKMAEVEARIRQAHEAAARREAAGRETPPSPPPPPTPPPVRERIRASVSTWEKLTAVQEIGETAIHAARRRDDAARQMGDLMRDLKGAKGAERRRIEAELDAVGRAHEIADLEASRHSREARAKVLNALLIDDKEKRLDIKAKVDPTSPVSKEVGDAAVGALNFVNRIVANAGQPGVKVKLAAIPADEEQRAHHLGGKDGLIRLGNKPAAGTMIHEMGHLLEDQVPGWAEKAREFLAYRTAGEDVRDFREVLGKQYGPHEKGRKDKFDDAFGDNGWYVGKEYKHGSTEITSMAIEKLFNDPVTFAAKDPEFFRWIVGMLDGSLR